MTKWRALGKDDPGFADLPLKTRMYRACASLTGHSRIMERCGEYEGITSARLIPPANTSKNCAANGF